MLWPSEDAVAARRQLLLVRPVFPAMMELARAVDPKRPVVVTPPTPPPPALPVTVVLRSSREPALLLIPPVPPSEIFPEIVLRDTVTLPAKLWIPAVIARLPEMRLPATMRSPSLKIPPPRWFAVLPSTVLLVRVRVPTDATLMPPPSSAAVLSTIVLFNT